MNPLKNMEIIFGAVAAAALLFAAMPERDARAANAANVARSTPTATAHWSPAASIRAAQDKLVLPTPVPLPTPAAAVATPASMAVVVIKGKHLNAREKRRAALTASAVAAPSPSEVR